MSRERAHLERAVADQFGRQLATETLLYHQAIAQRLGLNVTDLKCLDVARAEPHLTPGRLAELTGLTTAAVTSILDRLEQARLVRRERDPSDRRKVLVKLLSERAEEVSRLFAPLDQAMSHLLGQYTLEELAFLAQVADQVGSILQQETMKLREPEDGEGTKRRA